MTTPSGTAPELVVYSILVRLGYKPNVDFVFQSVQFGGRIERGGQIVDFFFDNPPGLAISVLGEYFHYTLRGGSRAHDLAERAQLAEVGITLIFIDEGDLMGPQAEWFVREALQFRDHSRIARGG
jgi:hypothetical protein